MSSSTTRPLGKEFDSEDDTELGRLDAPVSPRSKSSQSSKTSSQLKQSGSGTIQKGAAPARTPPVPPPDVAFVEPTSHASSNASSSKQSAPKELSSSANRSKGDDVVIEYKTYGDAEADSKDHRTRKTSTPKETKDSGATTSSSKNSTAVEEDSENDAFASFIRTDKSASSGSGHRKEHKNDSGYVLADAKRGKTARNDKVGPCVCARALYALHSPTQTGRSD
jgi:hypothetical protein